MPHPESPTLTNSLHSQSGPSDVIAEVVGAVKEYASGGGVLRALDDVTIRFARGQFTAIMGPSGSGKSTLLHCLTGLDRLTEGAAVVDGVTLGTLTENQVTLLRREKIGFVFQAFNLLPTMTAVENITLPADLARRAVDPDWYASLTETVGLTSHLHRLPHQLSGGQQQRVAVARALITRPAVIFADEPTGNLDSQSGSEVLGLLRHAARDLGQSVVMVTHDPVAASYCDEVIYLSDGRVVDRMHAPTAELVLDRMKSLGTQS